MRKIPMIMLGLATAVVLPVVSLNSCAVSGLTDEASVNKMPQPLRGMMLDLMRQEKMMLTRCSEGSARMALATATIAEGCGLEKEAQKLRAYAGALNKTSSNDDQKKYVVKGSNLIADVNKKIASATNATVKSKEKFRQGYVQKNQAEQALNQVAAREISTAVLKATQISLYCAKNKDALKSNPLAAVQMGMALNYSLLPIRFVAGDYKKFQEERNAFDEQCQQIGKKYAIPMPAPVKSSHIKLPSIAAR
jgi:hypothetical protein